MNACRGYRKLIGAVVDDTASSVERERLHAHLTHCDACRRAVRELRRTRELVTCLPPVQPSPRLMAGISSGLRAQRVSRAERVWWRASAQAWFQPAAVVALILLLVVTGTAVYQGTSMRDLLSHEAHAVAVYGGPAPSVAHVPTNDYLSSCVASHESFDSDRAFADADGWHATAYTSE